MGNATVQFLPTDAGLAKHQGAHVQIQGNSFRGQLNLSVNKITEAAPAALGQSELPVLDHPVTHDRKRGRSREAIMVPVTQTKAVAPWVASPLVGAIASSSGTFTVSAPCLHSLGEVCQTQYKAIVCSGP